LAVHGSAAEAFDDASEDCGCRDHRDLLADDLQDERAKQIEGRQSLHPCVGIKSRVLVDHPGEDWVSLPQPDEPSVNVLRLARCRHPLKVVMSRL
jgi:hypothetical protein